MLVVGHILAIVAVFIAGYASRPHIRKAFKKLRALKFKKIGLPTYTKTKTTR